MKGKSMGGKEIAKNIPARSATHHAEPDHHSRIKACKGELEGGLFMTLSSPLQPLDTIWELRPQQIHP
jgi:hypothetical protein